MARGAGVAERAAQYSRSIKMSERWYRFRLFVSRNTVPMVWLWSGTMLCALGTVYYRLRNGEDVTISLKDVHMQPNPDTIHKIHSWIKKLGLDQTIDNPRKK